jgi:hypothetical protein
LLHLFAFTTPFQFIFSGGEMLKEISVRRTLLALALIGPAGAWAVPNALGIASTAGQDSFDSLMSSTDLGESATVSGPTPSLGGLGGLHDGVGTPVGTDTSATLTGDAYFDGAAGFGASNLLSLHPAVTYTFNTGAGGSATGYNITSIISAYGWHDHASFSDQDYSISYSTVANPNVFVTLTSVAYNPFDPANDNANAGGQYNSSQVTVTDSTGVLASGVTALEFTFTPYFNVAGLEQSGQVVREIDVNGVATVLPEPGALGLVAGSLILGMRRRNK